MRRVHAPDAKQDKSKRKKVLAPFGRLLAKAAHANPLPVCDHIVGHVSHFFVRTFAPLSVSGGTAAALDALHVACWGTCVLSTLPCMVRRALCCTVTFLLKRVPAASYVCGCVRVILSGRFHALLHYTCFHKSRLAFCDLLQKDPLIPFCRHRCKLSQQKQGTGERVRGTVRCLQIPRGSMRGKDFWCRQCPADHAGGGIPGDD